MSFVHPWLPIDANTAILLLGQETVAGNRLADATGNETNSIPVTGSPLALQPGPVTGLFSRYADGINTKYFNGAASSSVWLNAVQNQMTLEMCFASELIANSQNGRTLYALGSGSTKFWWLLHGKTLGRLTVDWTHGGVEQSACHIPFVPTDGDWYYLAMRKTVTSGSTVSNRVFTLEMWLRNITAGEAWTNTPDGTFTGQTNPDDVGTPNNSVGIYPTGFFPASLYFAGLRGSASLRSNTELRTAYEAFAGLTEASGTSSTFVLSGPAVQADDAIDYGTDVRSFPDLDDTLSLGNGPAIVVDAVARRFVTTRGALWAHPTYGRDLRNYLNESIDEARLQSIRAEIEEEARQDERVQDCQALVTWSPDTSSMRVSFVLQLSRGQPFRFTLNVTQLTVELLQEA